MFNYQFSNKFFLIILMKTYECRRGIKLKAQINFQIYIYRGYLKTLISLDKN